MPRLALARNVLVLAAAASGCHFSSGSATGPDGPGPGPGSGAVATDGSAAQVTCTGKVMPGQDEVWTVTSGGLPRVR